MRSTILLLGAGAMFAAMVNSTLAQNAQPQAPQPNQAKRSDETRKDGQGQPQGPTGPLETSSGGTSPSSPQGDTPPGMQPTPEQSPNGKVKSAPK
jgi:hypothetical protein